MNGDPTRPAVRNGWRHESFGRAWVRRSATVPAYLAAAVALPVATLALLPVAAAFDLSGRRRLGLSRGLLLANLYVLAEAVGIAVCLVTWLRYQGWRRVPSRQYLDANYALQADWASALFAGARWTFGLKVRVDGSEVLRRAPLIVLARHASPLDNLVPAVFITARHRLRLRWVINRWLLRDPCLDIVGNRLPNAFVDTGGGEPRGQSARVAALAAGLRPDEGVLIYPEGALFSRDRLARAVERFEPSSDEGTRAARLGAVLPPRSGAFIAALSALPEADIVICAHRGLDSASSYRALLSGGLVGGAVTIRFQRIRRSEVPATAEGQAAWLWDAWEEVDRWVSGN